jgi:hypothetical protein
MSNLIARAEAAIAAWKSGAITHSLHVELADLVQAFHAAHTAEPQDTAPVTVSLPPKESDPA